MSIESIKDLIEYAENKYEIKNKRLKAVREELEAELADEEVIEDLEVDFSDTEFLIEHVLFQTSRNIDVELGIQPDKIIAVKEHLLELDAMIGMKSLKESVVEMIMYYIQDFHQHDDYLHTVISGPAGCGKTTCARLLGKIFSGLGILSEDKFTILKRTDLIAKYLGQTADKTLNSLNECLGAVCFIDEAYSLAPKGADRDSFSKECIDTLNEFLSEHKNDFICIIAGYSEELEATFFNMNQGLKRRFPWKFVIEPYTPSELLSIFHKLLRDIDWEIEDGAINASFFNEHKKYFLFAGGDIETFITKCKFSHVKRIFDDKNSVKKVLNDVDIKTAIKKHIQHKSEKVVNEPPPLMYI